ncbi:MAG TPA: universal stress protein [Candidatus Acidoferrales bacterium]|jgi:nucleotide-binding universal stress UspA family protein|nr:universal stress protein [Candidatus Acidoferrales bacterium]
MIRSILFPVDFSPATVAIAGYVRRAAVVLGASVTLVHVFDLASNNGYEIYARSPSDVAAEHRLIAQEKLDSFSQAEFPGTECSRILLSGDAAVQITWQAKAGGFDLIIMPTHAGRFRRMLLGSTTAKVLNDSDCPVLTTQHAETIVPRPLEHREWLCAIGLDGNAEKMLRFAAQAATAARARLSLIHAIQAGRSDLDATATQEAREHIEKIQKKAGCDAPLHIAVGPNIKQALVEAVGRSDADVVIIGRGPRDGVYGRMRDLTYQLARDSRFPVLSF